MDKQNRADRPHWLRVSAQQFKSPSTTWAVFAFATVMTAASLRMNAPAFNDAVARNRHARIDSLSVGNITPITALDFGYLFDPPATGPAHMPRDTAHELVARDHALGKPMNWKNTGLLALFCASAAGLAAWPLRHFTGQFLDHLATRAERKNGAQPH